jgi:hypothetical protein
MKQQLNVAVESLATLSAMLTTTQSTNVEKQRAALTDAGLGEFKTALLDFTETDMKGAGGNEYLPDMLTNAKAVLKQIPAGKVDSYESEATSAKPITTNNDAVIPAGYGDRILTFPEDTLQADVAFKNNDTIVAGTSLAGNNSSTTSTGATGNNSSTSPGGATDNVLLAVGRMIVAAINSKGSNLFAATTMNDSTYQT